MQSVDLHVLRAFDQACNTFPDKLAVTDDAQSLSYAELALLSSRLAGVLRARGIGRGDLVCILGQRSVDFVIAALAVWRCAAGYVPISDDTPRERMSYVVRETRSPIVICVGDCETNDARYVSMASLDISSSIPLAAELLPSGSDVAYVIYTSGSTGAPKGVVVGQDSLGAVLDAYCTHYGIGPADRVSAVANIGFDASMIELWSALSRGASVHIGSREILHSIHGLTQWLALEEVSVCWLPTPIVEVLVGTDGLELPNSLRRIETAGERLKARPRAGWKIPLHNSYGPTETTVIATTSLVDAVGIGAPDIGRPLPGVIVHVLDGERRPVAPGGIGELFVGGIGVARGYLNQPQLTSERFVLDPFSEEPGARMYATGDLCRWSESGCLEFIARNDGQVKVRGNRVELGEIEQAMITVAGVRQAICRVVDQRLVGYYTCDPEVFVEGSLDSALRRALPSYMVPDLFMELANVPLSVNGKTDYQALPIPGPPGNTVDEDDLDEGQRAFLDWYRQVSGIDLAWNDDFFRSGGNSVGAIVLLEAMRRRYGPQLGLREFFSASSPAAAYERGLVGADGESTPLVEITPRHDTQRVTAPLSASQRSVWFMAGLHPDDRAYHAKAYVVFDADLCVEALRGALSDVVARHEIYRTTFVLEGDEPLQRIHPPFEVALEVIDRAWVSRCAAAPELQLLLRGDINRPFELGRLSLARWALVRLAGGSCALLHVEHHLVHDGWSYNLFLRDLVAAYRGRTDGQSATRAAPAPLQYADFCVAQKTWLENGRAQVSEEYWLEALKDAPARTNLPTNGHVGEGGGQTLRVPFPRKTWQQIEALSRRHQCTPFAFVLGAFSYLLSRYSGDEDVCIGSAFANRSWGGADEIIGMVINTVVLRATVAGNDTVSDHLQRCMQVCLDAQTHQAYPFERLVQLLNPTRVGGENPLFQVFLGFHDSTMPELALPGAGDIRVTEALDSASSKFDLSLVVIPRPGQEGEDDPVHMLWEFKRSRFAPWFVHGLIGGFARIVDGFLASPDQPLVQVPLENPAIDAVLSMAPVHAAIRAPYDRIRVIAARTPDRVAVRFRTQSVTYSQLVASVDTKAATLVGQGIGHGDLVGISLPRSIDLVAWMLAAQSVGAAYVPLDPGYPPARLAYIIDHCNPRIVIRDPAHVGGATNAAARFIPEPRDRAYVIYTSGSTGRPKGVVVDHGNLSAFLDAMEVLFPLGEDDRWCAVTSASFDISILECYLPLSRGAMLVLADDDEVRDAGRMAVLLSTQSVNHLQATPATWRALLDTGWRPSSTCFIGLCGGEAMPGPLAAELLAKGVRLYNMYGPTETTIWSCVHAVRSVDAVVPIGKPIAGTQALVLDARMQPMPQGAVGELWIGGAGVAQGYLNDAEQTAERFQGHPLAGGGRLYKTGDLASRDDLGNLYFHGRSDSQVKLRGYRIELAEVEATLASAPGMCQCAVTVLERGGSPILVAHVVLRAGCEIENMKAHCAQTLPGYMLPDLWVSLERLPMTPNGKINRAALPAPVFESQPHAPCSGTEAELEGIYAALLGVGQVDTRKGFYAIGGHSLLAMRLVARINREYATDISVTEFLRLDSVRAVAARLDEMRGESAFLEIVI